MPSCIECFATNNPEDIIKQLQLATGKTIDASNTLLFLDEIQEAPNAILSLRYFKEKMPGLPVIAAGSLLEFVLNDEEFRMPVGRIEFLHLYPLDFKEFLVAIGESHLVDWLEAVTINTKIPETIHQKCLKLVRDYCYVGGMPDVVNNYVQNQTDIEGVQNQQSKLLQGYRLDFGKYAKTKNQHNRIQLVFDRLSGLATRQVKYSKIDADSPSRDIKAALNDLKLAGLCQFVYCSNGAGVPLVANVNTKKFKLLFLDVGLYLRDLRLDLSSLIKSPLNLINSGAVAEQYVGQQLITNNKSFESAELYFWSRDKRGSQAEVDYLWQVGSEIIPIEVKSGTTGRLKALQIFMQQYKSSFGIRVCASSLKIESNKIVTIPLYLATEISRIAGQIQGAF